MTIKAIVATAGVAAVASLASTAAADQFSALDDTSTGATTEGGSAIILHAFPAEALDPQELAQVRATGTDVGNGMPADLAIFDTKVRNRITLIYNRQGGG